MYCLYGGPDFEGNTMIYIIRHGQTEENIAHLLLGRTDVPLNETGRRQAADAGERFAAAGIRFDAVYTSPLSRAVDTAKIIAGEETVLTEDDRLLEMDFGPFEGISLDSPPPEIVTFFKDFVHNPAPEGMESLFDLVARLGDFLEELAEGPADKNILVSTHAIAMKAALEYLTPGSHGAYWSKYIENCAVYVTERLPDGTLSVPQEWRN